MTHRNIQLQTLQATPPNVPVALFAIAAALILVLVLITVQPGAGIGFA